MKRTNISVVISGHRYKSKPTEAFFDVDDPSSDDDDAAVYLGDLVGGTCSWIVIHRNSAIIITRLLKNKIIWSSSRTLAYRDETGHKEHKKELFWC